MTTATLIHRHTGRLLGDVVTYYEHVGIRYVITDQATEPTPMHKVRIAAQQVTP